MRAIRNIALVLSFGISATWGQDLKKDLLKFNQYLNTLNQFQIQISYAGGDSTELKDEKNMSVFVSKEGLFYAMDENAIVMNPDNTMIIDDKERTIIYSDNAKPTKSTKGFDIQKDLIQGFESMLEQTDSIYFAKTNKGINYYLRIKDGYFNLVELQFQQDKISDIVYYYNPKYVEQEGLKAYNHLTIDENPDFDKNLLGLAHYIQKHGEEALPTEEFKQYKLIYNESSESLFK